MYRWDAEKRRLSAELSGPSRGSPKFRYGLLADLRSENWDIRNSFQAPSAAGNLNMRREAVGASFSSFENGRWHWSAGGEVSHRDFPSVIPGTVLTPSLLAGGYELKKTASVDTVLLRLPERRLTIEGGASSQAGDYGRNLRIPSRRCKVPPIFTGSLDPRATIMKCSTGSRQARRLETFHSTNSTCWDWSETTTCGCAATLEPATAEKAARRWVAIIFCPIGKPTGTCMEMESSR